MHLAKSMLNLTSLIDKLEAAVRGHGPRQAETPFLSGLLHLGLPGLKMFGQNDWGIPCLIYIGIRLFQLT